MKISIHAPRVGRDFYNSKKDTNITISIHAPRVGRDSTPMVYHVGGKYFNPRAPCGARPITLCGNGYYLVFQSTRPVWGATGRKHDPLHTEHHFNPRAPCGARRDPDGGDAGGSAISIHAPRVGRDQMGLAKGKKKEAFQSTRPVWGATARLTSVIAESSISIHAPRVGRDCFWRSINSTGHYFNPRAPCGARQNEDIDENGNEVISIHAPRVGRDQCWKSSVPERIDFNPRAPCGARRIPAKRFGRVRNFNPRAPCGARRGRKESIVVHSDFNPRAPCGARQQI